jgi:hypothetical protein
MTSFQLDECFNDKRLAKACNSERRCKVLRYPRRLKKQKDPKVLADLLARNSPLLTTDFTILDDNTVHIPQPNSGMIVVRSRYPRRPFTSKSAAANLLLLKERFSAWSEIDWSGIYVEIDEEEIMVCPLEGDSDRQSFLIRFDEQDFEALLNEKLDAVRRLGIQSSKSA